MNRTPPPRIATERAPAAAGAGAGPPRLALRIAGWALDLRARDALRPLEQFVPGDHSSRARLEAVVRAFHCGYSASLRERRERELSAALSDVPAELRGFAHEGAGMGLAVLDALLPARSARLLQFARGRGAPHAYMLLVGAGWAAARLARPFARRVLAAAAREPLLHWLAWDGYGFHAGYFAHRRTLREHRVPRFARGYARRAFDQGVGRCLWFAEAEERSRIPGAIRGFAPERRADLWSGVGLACAYAGGESEGLARALLDDSGAHRAHFAQGVAFAAAARERAGNPAAHTAMACAATWRASPEAVAALAGRARVEAECSGTAGGEEPTYELWRGRLREMHAMHEGSTEHDAVRD